MSRRLPFPLSVTAALTLGAGLAATAGMFVAVSHLEYERMALAFEQRASARVAAVRQGLREAVEVLTVTNQLFTTVTPVTRAQFHAFTRPLLERYPFITAFNYHRVVEGAERAAVEAELQALRPGTILTELVGRTRRAAPQREQYHIVDYLEPMQGNEAAFGLNVSSNAEVMETLRRATRSGRAAASGLLSLAQDNTAYGGVQVIMPVYRAGAPLLTVDQRQAALVGDTAAIIRASELVRSILARGDLLADPSVSVAVFASGQPEPRRLVFSSANASATRPVGGPALPDALGKNFALDFRQRQAGAFDVAGQLWLVEVAAAPRPFLQEHLASFLVLVGGTLLSLLLTALVHNGQRRARRVERLVHQRTGELEQSNRLLQEDVLERQRTEEALQESEQRFRQLAAMSSDWFWEQDAELRFTTVTGGFVEKSGISIDRLLGKTHRELMHGIEDPEWGQRHFQQCESRLPFVNVEYPVRDDEGNTRWFCVHGTPVFDHGGVFKGYRGTGADITERKLTEQRIHHVAQHDVLTGLPNRSLLQDRLGQAIAYSERSSRPVWVMLIDLDRFKFVNDSMGHKAGDVLLMTVAARLRGALRDTDTVARLSGDEFVAILTEHDDQRLSVDVVQRVMDAVAQPVLLGSKEFFVTCSVGVAVYPLDGAPADSLIEHADIAMYRAKKLGRNNFQFYTPAMNDEALERVRIEGALRNAVERNEFVLHYQPQVELATGQIVGMEALIRWKHPELGMVAPSRFIGVAEETGLIVPIGAWVMRAACQQNKAWQDAGLGRLRVAVNLSARQFSAPNLMAEIGAVLRETGLAPACLEIELTESLFMSDVTLAVELLHGMKALGVNLSIDDFGTGYSSLSYLSRFPIDVLKIDRSFVADIRHDRNDAAIVTSIIALAHNLKLAVIAEGVETEEQLDYLRRHGCDEIQGYYFSPPLPAAEFEQLLRQNKTLPLLSVTGQAAA